MVGPGRARVQLSAEFDFNRITETLDKFDPEGRVLRSSQTREESACVRQPGRPGHRRQRIAGRAANAARPAARQPHQAQRDQSKKSEEIVNYEISRSTKTQVTEGGRVKRISAAVLVDGSYAKNDKGESAYQPRTKEELDRIAALVRSAIGFDQKRGDQIEVVNLRFAEAPAAPIAEAGRLAVVPAAHQRRHHAGGRACRDGAARSRRAAVRGAAAGAAHPDRGAADRRRDRRTGDRRRTGGAAVALPDAASPADPASQTSKMIDMAQVQGQVHAQSMQKVGELAERNPNETVAIVRQWLQDAPA